MATKKPVKELQFLEPVKKPKKITAEPKTEPIVNVFTLPKED